MKRGVRAAKLGRCDRNCLVRGGLRASMMALESVEVRWFGEGPPPAALREWFHGGDVAPQPQGCRSDLYLVLRDSNALGVKLREGRVDLKQRSGLQQRTAFGDDLSGLVESWRKWSFASPDAQLPGCAEGEADVWVPVLKERWLIRYEASANAAVSPCGPDAYPRVGVHLELTRLGLGRSDGPWWTVGAEAFGPSDELGALLRVAVKRHTERCVPGELRRAISCGYPGWLRQAALSV